ncbi:gliding motility-associated ABC transporter permease subunit GldF [Christiangramia sabulilitoris]|uniref:Gliding motility-associated ABC transporter permease subunit GldF n=1 Tax=Christiangramia sabulilitoris TaxID=2583991 RepID=A0A550HXF6_9FLAO|nr:gliding motility-associated ABC transporter permease subunit GldF [Christiangramia sabulilitoris]TRO63376.1 gliding motility-associated ABC transporter permease subunit GldF [Christiangramia sabulilitoris]
MLTIFNKEIRSFFSSLTGYLVIGLFLIASGFFLFVFRGGYNILDSGFADLKPLFSLAPWIFLFLIPAIAMKTFSEETRMGTMELLLTKPIGLWKLILGKYLAVIVLVILAIVPTFLYVLTIQQLGKPVGNFDVGATIGSYIGLIFLGGCYAAIGIFASSLTSNQIVAFLLAVFLGFISFYAFEAISQTDIFGTSGYLIEYFGINFHYKSISRGVVDTRDLIYFLSLMFIFLKLTEINLSAKRNLK